MIKTGSLVMLMLMSAYASSQSTEYRSDIAQIDTNKFCLYEEKVYSIGAIIEVGGKFIECKEHSGMQVGNDSKARWVSKP